MFLRREVHADFWCGNWKKMDHLENVNLDGRVMLKFILKKKDGRVYTGCTLLGYRDKCQAVVNMAVNFGVP